MRRIDETFLESLMFPIRLLAADDKAALIRENFRCMVSGAVDMYSYSETEEIQVSKYNHAFSEFTNTSLSDDAKEIFKGFSLDYPAKAWTIIKYFGHSEIQDELAGDGIHFLTNILTLGSSLNTLFDILQLWLEPTEIPNRYKVGTSADEPIFKVRKFPAFVEFTSTDSQLKLPSVKYSHLHAALLATSSLLALLLHCQGVGLRGSFDGLVFKTSGRCRLTLDVRWSSMSSDSSDSFASDSEGVYSG
ncbi:hypothetical protein ARMGADRAFT_1084722 [Armillaria gallica]|uniref:HNH nuclease domain-containing protein n=1 Tax=Armillaria gallica TaxID=47427 RepID=A0A2H3DJG4_ARMGA|nr:hypothetical protein ARMGADRAFT_1084722 [Armillaria gallica]